MIARSPALKTSLGLLLLALLCIPLGDFEISTLDPWSELARVALGALTPHFDNPRELGLALLNTVAFGVLGVALAAVVGFGLALGFHLRYVRVFCALIRAVHELFWALIFLQLFGLSALTGVLAIAIPYAGVFGKIYAEILEEGDTGARHVLPLGVSRVSDFCYARLPDLLQQFWVFTLYRLECGLRSSAVLGFIGLPTLGFHLESAFKQGHYSETWALLLVFYLLIASLRVWLRPALLPLYLAIALWVLDWHSQVSLTNILLFVTHDIVPAPLRDGGWLHSAGWSAFADWSWNLLSTEAAPGVAATLILSQVALAATGILALLMYPWVSRRLAGGLGHRLGHLILVVMRSTPEYVLGFMFLILLGPSMLPAVLALALHNAAIVAHLIGREADQVTLRPDAARGLNLYAYELTPRLYGPFLSFLFYRWETIVRETAILGMLGIYTLGFYVDSAFEEIRFDRAMLLIALTAALNVSIDWIARRLRQRLHLQSLASCQ